MIVSQGLGPPVTVYCAVNATSQAIPPIFVLIHAKVNYHWKLTAPTGTKPAGHPKALSWMTTEQFVDVLKHFTHVTKARIAKLFYLLKP